jgi:3-oxoadipate enol-lactonase
VGDISVPGIGKVHYEECGEGPVLVQVHGLGVGFGLSRVTPILSRSFRCINVDLPGYGGSDAPTKSGGVVDLADDLARFLRAFTNQAVFLHGNSFGGQVVLALAARHAQLVSRLIISASLARDDKAVSQRRRVWSFVAGTGDPLAYADVTIETGFARDFYETDEAQAMFEEMRRLYVKHAANMPAWIEGNRSLVRTDGMQFAGAIRAPTLCIGGADDILTPVEPAASGAGLKALSECIAQCTLEVVPQAGHYVMLEKPERCAELIRDFCAPGP